jgi:hypothetical protein
VRERSGPATFAARAEENEKPANTYHRCHYCLRAGSDGAHWLAYNERNRLLPGRRLKMTDALSAMEYPHWLMVAGAVLVVVGFIGVAFRKNRNAEPDREPDGMKAKK